MPDETPPEAPAVDVPEVRTTKLTMVPVGDLTEHPRNPRRGDVPAIGRSMLRHGFAGALVVQRSTGHVLAGNHTLKAARERGLARVPVLFVDMDDAQALSYMLDHNRSSDLAGYDDAVLIDDLHELAALDMLDDVLWDPDDLQSLFGDPNAANTGEGGGSGGDTRVTIRSVVLPYSLDDYETVTAALTTLQERLGLESFSEVVLHLIADVAE